MTTQAQGGERAWKDASNYSRNEVRGEPKAWQLEMTPRCRIYITKDHIYHRGRWVMHCEALGISTHPLADGISAHDAKASAYNIAKAQADKLTEAFKVPPTLEATP